jgi:hypothetical protein
MSTRCDWPRDGNICGAQEASRVSLADTSIGRGEGRKNLIRSAIPRSIRIRIDFVGFFGGRLWTGPGVLLTVKGRRKYTGWSYWPFSPRNEITSLATNGPTLRKDHSKALAH